MTNAAAQPPQLQPAAAAEGPPPEVKPAHYSADFLIEFEGYQVRIAGEELKPADLFAWIKRTVASLKQQGFTNVERGAPTISIPAPAAAAAAAAGAPAGDAVEIPGVDGAPPKCSLHGTMEFKEGNYRDGHAKAGQRYAFWACKVRSCRPKKQ